MKTLNFSKIKQILPSLDPLLYHHPLVIIKEGLFLSLEEWNKSTNKKTLRNGCGGSKKVKENEEGN